MKFCYLYIFLFLGIFISGCVESVNDPNGSGAAGSLSIKIIKPAENDTVHTGQNLVTYTASDYQGGKGLSYFEIYLGSAAKPQKTYKVAADGTNPQIFFNIDSSMTGSTTSLYIIAYDQEGKLAQSNGVMNLHIVKNTDAPLKPDNLSLTKFSDSSMLLSWRDNADNEDGYLVYRSEGDNQHYGQLGNLPKGSTSYTDGTTVSGKIYYYRVGAYNQYGQSQFSNEVCSNGSSSGGQAPSGLKAQALGASKAYLSWIDNSNNENGIKVIRRPLYSKSWATVAILPPNSVSWQDNGLQSGNSYMYRVTAFTNNQEFCSDSVSVTTYSRDVPEPQNLKAVFNSSSRSMVLSWTTNTYYEIGTHIERRIGISGTYQEIGTTLGGVTTFTDSNISANTDYYYRARYYTTDGFYTAYSNEVKIQTSVFSLPAPTSLILSEFSPNLLNFTWSDNSADEDGFELWYHSIGDTAWVLKTKLAPNSQSINIVPDDPAIVYYYRIRAYRGGLYSGFSNEVMTSGGLVAPGSLTASMVSSGVRLSWVLATASASQLGVVIQRKSLWDTQYTEIAKLGKDAKTGQFPSEYTDVFTPIPGITYQYRVGVYNQVTARYSDSATYP